MFFLEIQNSGKEEGRKKVDRGKIHPSKPKGTGKVLGRFENDSEKVLTES